jgi:hypothetical protein
LAVRNGPPTASGASPFLVIAFGLVYTGYSEWLNATVRQSWTYSDLMPVIPWLGLGLSPMLQWLVIPSLALAAARRGRLLRDTSGRSKVAPWLELQAGSVPHAAAAEAVIRS